MPLILLVIGLVLIFYNYRAIKREDETNRETNGLNISFQSVLEDNKQDFNDYKMEIGLLRKDIAESLTELQEEILELKNNFNILKNGEKIYENKEELEKAYFSSRNDVDNKINNDNIKAEDEKIKEINMVDNAIDENSDFNLKIEEGVISEIDFSEKVVDSSKTQNIKKLLKEGLTEEEICHELSVSKGEVLLVKGLFKK